MLPPEILVPLTVTFPDPTAAINAVVAALLTSGWKRKTSGAAGNVLVAILESSIIGKEIFTTSSEDK